MPRVASLWLPFLPIDRLLRRERGRGGIRQPEPSTFPAEEGDPPEPRIGARIEDCSSPRGGGWRPGARWAREEREARIAKLPAHQHPPMRELGRRTEPAKTAFHDSHSSFASAIPVEARARPFVTVHRSGNRVAIAAACPVAEALGLLPGMAATQARALVPDLEVVDSQLEKDAAFLERLAVFAARRWTPRAAVSGDDGLWLDLSGVAHLFGGEENMCRRILRFLVRLGFDARIAVAGTFGAAHALVRYGNCDLRLCPAHDEAEALAHLPIAALRIAEDVVSAARRLGIESIGDLLAMPRGPLERRFGSSLLLRLDQALGRSPEAIDPVVPQDPPSVTLRFLEPIATAEAISEALDRLIAMLVDRLEKKGLAVRALLLIGDRVDGEEQRIGIGTARATRDGRHLFSLLAARIERIEPGFGIEAMHLFAPRCEPLGPKAIDNGLVGDTENADLAHLVDRLAGRLGARRLFRLSSVESDVPERSLRRVSPLETAQSWPAEWPRPVRLLARPEPAEKVVALLPDGPPRRFTWRGQTHVVRHADGPERIYGEWWKKSAEADAVRDYFQVEDEVGGRFWIFRRGDGVDPRTGDLSWHVHGFFG